MCLVPPPGIELGINAYKAIVIPFNYRGLTYFGGASGSRTLSSKFGGECGIRTHGPDFCQASFLAGKWFKPTHPTHHLYLATDRGNDPLWISSVTVRRLHHAVPSANIINCGVMLWTVISRLPFAFIVTTYMEYPSILDPLSLIDNSCRTFATGAYSESALPRWTLDFSTTTQFMILFKYHVSYIFKELLLFVQRMHTLYAIAELLSSTIYRMHFILTSVLPLH